MQGFQFKNGNTNYGWVANDQTALTEGELLAKAEEVGVDIKIDADEIEVGAQGADKIREFAVAVGATQYSLSKISLKTN